MNPHPEKKKTFIMFPSVKDFMREQSGDVKKELNGIVFILERDGTLSYPYAEKIQGFEYSMSTGSETGSLPFMATSRKHRTSRNGKWPLRGKR